MQLEAKKPVAKKMSKHIQRETKKAKKMWQKCGNNSVSCRK